MVGKFSIISRLWYKLVCCKVESLSRYIDLSNYGFVYSKAIWSFVHSTVVKTRNLNKETVIFDMHSTFYVFIAFLCWKFNVYSYKYLLWFLIGFCMEKCVLHGLLYFRVELAIRVKKVILKLHVNNQNAKIKLLHTLLWTRFPYRGEWKWNPQPLHL